MLSVLQIMRTVQPLRDRFPKITDEDVLALFAISTIKAFKKYEVAVPQGTQIQKIALVLSGVVRTYTINEDGDEITLLLHRPIDFLGTWESVFLGRANTRIIDSASHESILMMVDYHELKNLLTHNERIREVYYSITEYMHADLLMFYQTLLSSKPEARYKYLLTWLGEHANQVSQRLLASFMGLNPVSLSRIKKRIEEE